MYPFKNVDATLGSKSLITVAEQFYETLDDKRKFQEFQLCQEFKRLYKESWLLSFLCSYDERNVPKLGDMMYYKFIRQMVLEGTLFMKTFEIESWAFPDAQFENNCNLVKEHGFTFSLENKRNSDGFWTMNEPVTLGKIYPNDELTPPWDEMVKFEMLQPNGLVEFGGQKICKTAVTLAQGYPLLRVPYAPLMEWGTCKQAALFYNTKPFNPSF